MFKTMKSMVSDLWNSMTAPGRIILFPIIVILGFFVFLLIAVIGFLGWVAAKIGVAAGEVFFKQNDREY